MRSGLRWVRLRRAALAALVLAGISTGPLVLPHADPLGDPACAPVLTSHDEHAHRFTRAASPDDTHPQHCYACHWARSFPVLLRTGGHVASPAAAAERLHAPAVQPRHQIAWALSPGRAPPA